MPQGKFLTVASNILYKSLIEASRTEAKKLFNTVCQGKRIALLTVRMEDGSDLRFDLSLDSSEFRGNLNFGAFRASVMQLLAAMGETLQAEKEVQVFTEENDGSVLFGLPGVSREGDQINVLMLSANMRAAGTVLLKLMYMDPQQFSAAQQTG